MNDYIVATNGGGAIVIRTADWVVIAECSSVTFANAVALALNA